MREREQKPTPYGGQALIEGVMIRGPRGTTMAARRPNGQIIVQSEAIEQRPSYTRVPLLRGIYALYDSLQVGIRSLYWSARLAAGREGEPLSRSETIGAVAAIGGAAAIFIAGPVLLTGWITTASGAPLLATTAEGLLRIGLLTGYVWFIGRLPEVQRVFQYHGAEHRAVHAHEHGQALTVENLRRFPNAHPRCGTAFLLTVGVLSMALFVTLGTPPLWLRLTERFLLTPLVAAVAYEFLRATQALEASPLARALGMPNLWLQRLTTRDPDDRQMEVAIAALSEAIALGDVLEMPLHAAVIHATVDARSDEL